ncbi:hypothetical protein [Trichloromonas acetexigens]|uniref:hypothetical protein n=1 Tax=Trichloromonas acetexigens TaxID=38815 RepID=UPI001478D82D|nr:hypothetical protein [Desulfuromonas acetexigens]
MLKEKILIILILFLFSINSHSAEFDVEEFSFDAAKRIISVVEFAEDVEKASKYTLALYEAKEKIDALNGIIQNIDEEIFKLNFKSLVGYAGSEVTKSSKEAVETISNSLDDLTADRKIFADMTTVLKADLVDTFKLSTPSLKGSIGELKGKIGLGTVVTAIDVAMDIVQRQERISQGSTGTLENLNIALKVVESFGPPTIPLTKSPSDVARAIIDYQGALKQKTSSFLNGNILLKEGTEDFVNGELSFEAYILRKFEGSDFVDSIDQVGKSDAYAKLRTEYMDKYGNHLESLYETRAMLEKERDGALLDVSKENYVSGINLLNILIGQMNEKSNLIWSNNVGFDLMVSLHDLGLAKNELSSIVDEIRINNDEQKSKISSVLNEVKFIRNDVSKFDLSREGSPTLPPQAPALEETSDDTSENENAVSALRVRESELRNALGIIRNAESKGASPSKINSLLTDIANKLGMSTNDFRLQVENLLIVNQQELLALGEEPLKVDFKLLNKLERNEKLTATKDNMKSELETKSREQLALQNEMNKIEASMGSLSEYNSLKNQEMDLENQLSQIEQQMAGNWNNTGALSQKDLDKLEKYLEAYGYASNLYNKYNGDISKLTGTELAHLKVRASIVFGAGKFYDVLFNSADSRLANLQEQKDRYYSAAENTNGEDLESQRQEIKNRLSSMRASLSSFDSSLVNNLRTVETDRNSLSRQIEENRLVLADLVSDIQDLNRRSLYASQPDESNDLSYIDYGGRLTAITGGGWVTSAGAYGPDDGTAPFIGMELNPENNGVFSGDFKIATLTNTDSSGPYNYLSWGTWAETTRPQTYTDPGGHVVALEGGFWVMGQETDDIPRQGSAVYQGQLSGDYRSAGVRSPGIMSGSVTLNANFSNETIAGNVNILKNNSPWLNSTLTNGAINLQDGDFQADLSGVAAGGIGGDFYGPNGTMPTEAGGDWWLFHNDGNAAGIFRAKKQ